MVKAATKVNLLTLCTTSYCYYFCKLVVPNVPSFNSIDGACDGLSGELQAASFLSDIDLLTFIRYYTNLTIYVPLLKGNTTIGALRNSPH